MEFIHKQYKSIRYLKVLPNEFDKNTKYPVLIFLHGAVREAWICPWLRIIHSLR